MHLRALIVGERWGAKEQELNHPLVGASGVELSLMLGQIKFAPYLRLKCDKCGHFVYFTKPFCPNCSKRIYPNEFDLMRHWALLRNDHSIGITNVFNAYPPHDELGHFFGDDRVVEGLIRWKPSRKVGGAWLKPDLYHHIERLWNEVDEARPNVVVAMGNAACWALLNQTKISDLRGSFNWSKKCNVKVIPTYHPANILRNYSDRSTVLADLDKARRESAWPEIRRPKRWFTIPYPDERGIAEIEEWLSRPATAYTNDIETARGQISIVGFARSRDDAIIIPFHADAGDLVASLLRGGATSADDIALPVGNSFWPTEELEFRAWKLVIKGLKSSTRKIGQNWLYDLSYLVRDGMLPNTYSGVDDTMLRQHANFVEMRKGLGHLSSIYLDEINWKPLGRANALKRDE